MVQNAPVLLPGLELFYAAFCELSTDRSIGMGEGPIPWSSIRRYCEYLGADEELADALQSHIRSMDSAYLEHRAKKTPAAPKGVPKQPAGGGKKRGRPR